MKNLLLALLLVCLCTCVRAQTYVSVTPQETLTAAEIGSGNPLIPTEYAVNTYKVLYNTIDAFGEPEVASGLLSIPQDSSLSFPLAVYMHGTVTNREAVPSRTGTNERSLVNILATNGYISLAPDYIGLGDSEGFHPYVHAASESSAGRDLILAARQWLAEQGIGFNDQLFITGYSQGGHAAQALHRDIQTGDGADFLEVTAGAHLSGPYDISGVMRRAALSQERATLPGFIVYTYVSYNNVYDIYDSLAEVFKEPYLSVINQYDREEIDGNTFNSELSRLLDENDERLIELFQDSIREQLENNDDDSRIVQALRDNDTYNWAPEAPTLLYYCTEDEQVPFQNALVADSVMTELGSTTVVTRSGGSLSHINCVPFALSATLSFFNDLARIDSVTTSVGRPTALPTFSVSPNPISAGSSLQLKGLPTGQSYTYSLYDFSGRQLQQGRLEHDRSIWLSDRAAPGVYLLRIGLPNGDFTVRRLQVR